MAKIPRVLIFESDRIRQLLRERLWLQVLIGMALGVGVGSLLAPGAGFVDASTSATIGAWLALPGGLFLAAVKFVVVPLVVASIVRGIAAPSDAQNLGAISRGAVAFFIATTLLASVLGIVAALIIAPGGYVDPVQVQSALGAAAPETEQALTLGDRPPGWLPEAIIGVLPTNPSQAFASGEMLQVVIAAIVLGVALRNVRPESARPVFDFMGSIQAVSMVIVQYTMRFAPIAVFGLLADLSARIGLGAIASMSVYVATVLVSLLALMGVYLAILRTLGGIGPRRFLASSRELLLMAFSTSSSAAVMPLSLETAEKKLSIAAGVTRFVIPLGATVNMAGTALYQSVATIFLAQVFDIGLSMGQIALVVAMATAAAIGAPGTPGIGIVILATILQSVGIPASGVILILGVDRLLDMCRTAVNVAGDLVAAAVIQRQIAQGPETTADGGTPAT